MGEGFAQAYALFLFGYGQVATARQSILINDTPHKQRAQIHQDARSGRGNSYQNCCVCGLGGGRMDSLYQPEIDSQKEITQITAEYHSCYTHG